MEENLDIFKDEITVMQLWKRMASFQDILDEGILSQTRITSNIREDNYKTSSGILYAGLVVGIQEIAPLASLKEALEGIQ